MSKQEGTGTGTGGHGRFAWGEARPMTLPFLRNLAVTIASGDALDIRQFTVHERMSSLFHVTLVAVSENADIDFDAVVGKPARFVMQGDLLAGTLPRIWSGLCAELHQLATVEGEGLSTYHLVIVPTLWLATQRRNHRMFQQLSELDIALALLDEWDIEPTKKLAGTYDHSGSAARRTFEHFGRIAEPVSSRPCAVLNGAAAPASSASRAKKWRRPTSARRPGQPHSHASLDFPTSVGPLVSPLVQSSSLT
jgi:hypothetical protein